MMTYISTTIINICPPLASFPFCQNKKHKFVTCKVDNFGGTKEIKKLTLQIKG